MRSEKSVNELKLRVADHVSPCGADEALKRANRWRVRRRRRVVAGCIIAGSVITEAGLLATRDGSGVVRVEGDGTVTTSSIAIPERLASCIPVANGAGNSVVC